MKICLVVDEYPVSCEEPIISGGIKNPFYLSIFLKNLGNDIVVITNGTNGLSRNADTECYKEIRIYNAGKGYLKGFLKFLISDLKRTIKLLRIMKKHDFDIIHAHSSPFFLSFLKRLGKLNVPIIVTAHGTLILEMKAELADREQSIYNKLVLLNSKIQGLFDSFSWRNSDKVITAGDFQIREMIDVYKIPEEKVLSISNGVDTNRYKPSTEKIEYLKEKLGIKDRRVVLYVGRLAMKKGVQYLIYSAPYVVKNVPNVVFLIIGGSDKFSTYETELRIEIKNLDLSDRFIILKNVPERDMPNYYNLAEICVVPSVNYEPLPTVIFEALATGKPIVASNLGGIPQQIGYDDFLIPEKDPESLADGIISILNNKELSENLSRKNRRRSKIFDWRKIANQHLDLYSKFIK